MGLGLKAVGRAVADINPALPIIKGMYQNSSIVTLVTKSHDPLDSLSQTPLFADVPINPLQ